MILSPEERAWEGSDHLRLGEGSGEPHGESGLTKRNIMNTSLYFVLYNLIISGVLVWPPQMVCELFESETMTYSY